jgi:flavorubredoxin
VNAAQDRDLTSRLTDPREVAPGIWWFPLCLELSLLGRDVHLHNSPYLILGADKALMWDSGDPSAWDELEPALDALLDGRPLDYVAISHSELPHSGNVHRLFSKFPGLRALGETRDYPLLFPDYVDRFVAHGIERPIDLGGLRFELLPAVIKDLPHTQWGYEASNQVLFTTDAFAYSHHPPLEDDDRPVHLPHECARFVSEIGQPPGPEQVVWITRAALYWARFLRMAQFRPMFDDLVARHPTRMIAPAHGALIDDMTVLPVIWDALDLAYDPEAGVAAAAAEARTS